MTVRGKIHEGRVVLAVPLPLADGTEVEVDVRPLAPAAADGTDGSASQLRDLPGTVEGLPTDIAENHDHYLKGMLRRVPGPSRAHRRFACEPSPRR